MYCKPEVIISALFWSLCNLLILFWLSWILQKKPSKESGLQLYGKEHLLLVLHTLSYSLGHPPDYSIITEECIQAISYYDSHIFFQGTDFLESLPILQVSSVFFLNLLLDICFYQNMLKIHLFWSNYSV